MKISKRQLRRIIREMHPRAGIDDAIFDYEEWARERGSPLGASSVMASYIIVRGIEDNHDTHQALALQFGLQHEDIMRELSMQQEERSINMGESKIKITKRQLRRIIREEKARLLNEQYSSAPTIVELLDDTSEIQNKLDAMYNVLEDGQHETPEMGGLTYEEAQSIHVYLANALHELKRFEEALAAIS